MKLLYKSCIDKITIFVKKNYRVYNIHIHNCKIHTPTKFKFLFLCERFWNYEEVSSHFLVIDFFLTIMKSKIKIGN